MEVLLPSAPITGGQSGQLHTYYAGGSPISESQKLRSGQGKIDDEIKARFSDINNLRVRVDNLPIGEFNRLVFIADIQ